jgi:hypothetical protein
MFEIKWFVQHKEHRAVSTENTVLESLDEVVAYYQGRFYGGKMMSEEAPDGFIVCNSQGAELRRWLHQLPPHAPGPTADEIRKGPWSVSIAPPKAGRGTRPSPARTS